MSNIKTWGDIIDYADEENFVGRTQEISLFLKELENISSFKLIFFISGQGGVGKTTLINRYRELAQNKGLIVLQSDDQQDDIPAVLGKFYDQLVGLEYKLDKFSDRYKKYREFKEALESDPKAPKGLVAIIGRTAASIGFELIDEVPIIRKGLKFINKGVVETHCSEWANYLVQKFKGKYDGNLLRNPVHVLSTLFFENLNMIALDKKILICLENFEYTRSYLDDWLLRLREYKPFHNICIAIASRTPPGPTWDQLKNVVLHIRLDVFSEDEAEDFLDKYLIKDPQRRKEILKSSGRLPILMSWLASPTEDYFNPSMPTADIVDRFLRWVKDPFLRKVVLCAAIPHFFDLDIITLLLDSSKADMVISAFKWLREMPFVSQQRNGWQYHSVVRLNILRYKRQESSQKYRLLHERLAEYFKTKKNELEANGEHLWSNELWRKYTLEYFYHYLVASPETRWSDFLSMFTLAFHNRRQFAKELIDLLISPSTREELNDTQSEIAELFEQQIYSIQAKDVEEGFEIFNTLCNTPNLSPQARAIANAYRGEIFLLQSHFLEALADFDKAIEIEPTMALAFLGRGKVHRELKHNQEALQDFRKSITLYPFFRHEGQKEIGLVLLDLGKTSEAMDAILKALEDQPACPECWSSLAKIYQTLYSKDKVLKLLRDFKVPEENKADIFTCRAMAINGLGYHEEAISDFNLALQIDNNDAYIIHERAWIYMSLKRYEEAISDFNRVIEIDRNQVAAIINQGLAFRELNRIEDAFRNFNYAANLDPNKSAIFAERGKTYLILKSYEDGLVDLNHAIELDDRDARGFFYRGQYWRQMGDINKSLKDFRHSIDLDQDFNHTGYKEIGITLMESGNFREAVNAFHKSLSYQPQCQECWELLLKTYLNLFPNYEEVLEDINGFIELYTDNSMAILCRVEIYKEMRCYNEALNDLEYAITLDKDLEKEFVNERGLLLSYLGRYEEALEIYHQELADDPNNSGDYVLLYNIAVAKARWQGIEKAQKEIKVARDALNDFTDESSKCSLFYGLGGLSAIEGNIEVALKYLKEALSNSEIVIDWATHDVAWRDLYENSIFKSLILHTEKKESRKDEKVL